jgi:hypothetical protein
MTQRLTLADQRRDQFVHGLKVFRGYVDAGAGRYQKLRISLLGFFCGIEAVCFVAAADSRASVTDIGSTFKAAA